MPNFGPSIAPILASLVRDEAMTDAERRHAVRRARESRRQNAAYRTQHHRSGVPQLAVLAVWVAVLALSSGWVATAYVVGHV